jgi:transketolase
VSHVGRGLRDEWGAIVAGIMRKHDRVVLLDADVSPATRADAVRREFSDRFVQFGCAEQNMVSAAAGIASFGLIPVLSIFACFCGRRVADQAAISIAYPRLNVKLVGSYAGLTTPNTGATHQSVDDVNIMRGIPNMLVFEAADAFELEQVMETCVLYDGPTYVRVVRCAVPRVLPDDYLFRIGRAAVLREGSDISLIASGMMVSRSLEAAKILAAEGVSAEVINMSSLKPVDADAIVASASKTGHVVTAENHSVIGGLGSAVAEVLAERCPARLKRVGIQDRFGTSGTLDSILERYGLTAENVVRQARILLGA